MNAADRNDMKSYFYFNDSEKEVCFKRHDTPSPWINYLTNGTFHAMLSQAGGGLAFYKSPQIWRITRYRFFHLPTDRSGPYLYIKDAETGEYWCPTYEPTLFKPQQWESAHGMGYSRFCAAKDGVETKLVYFVGKYENSLIWDLNVKNNSDCEKKLKVFAYVEFGMMEFMRELQWQCYNKHQLSVSYLSDIGALIYKYGVEMQPKPDETPLVYFAASRRPDAYDGDRDEFVGSYRSEANPYAIENGGCTNSSLMGGDPCGALEFNITLKPGQEERLQIFLGTGMTIEDIEKSLINSREPDFADRSFAGLKEDWQQYLDKFSCSIPDEDAQRMVNIWNPYQSERNFLFSRNISYYATGTFRGVGFRDTSQDILAMIPFDAERAKDKVKLLLAQQYQDGHTNHYFFPNEGWEPVKRIHSDNHLWIIMAVYDIIMETGSVEFLHQEVEYFDGGNATVWEHIKKSIEFTYKNIGSNGLPLMLHSDWNDMLYKVCREGKGESVMVAFQLGKTLQQMSELAGLLGEENNYLELYEDMKKVVNTIAWDGEWFIRGTMDDGTFIGSNKERQAKIWLNSQTWSVLSTMTDEAKGRMAMDSVNKYLDTELGIKKIHPSMKDYPKKEDPLTYYNPGTGENGAVFCHANTWAIIAECMLGRGGRAYKYYHQLLPSVAMEKAGIWRYKAEPYAYASNLFGPESDKFGLANVSWLTGTAAWMYVAVTQYILGLRASWEGLVVDPCIPSEWKGFEVEREFRGCRYYIEVINDTGINKGVRKMEVDGVIVKGNTIPHVEGRKAAEIKVYIGR